MAKKNNKSSGVSAQDVLQFGAADAAKMAVTGQPEPIRSTDVQPMNVVNFGPTEAAMMALRERQIDANFSPERLRGEQAARDARKDPTFAGSPEAWRAGLGLATSRFASRSPADMALEDLLAANAGVDTSREPRDLMQRGPAAPRMTEQDIMRAAQERLLQSQLQGFEGQRDLVSMLADMREEGFGSQEQFRKDIASQREGFLGEQDAKRAERFEAEAQQREQRKTTELARQQTQLNQALQASNIDTGAAGDRLASLGIDPGNFADADMSETTAMLYSQNMSAANFINSLDGVAQQAANFAKDANDQASAAALFGIGQDLAFGLQQVDQLRQQGLMDDAMAMQAIADAERQAREANDMAMANLDVETLRAAQAAAARAAAAAAAQRKTEATAASLGILANVREGGYQPTQADLMVLAEAGLGDAFLDIGESESSFLDDLALQEAGSARDLENSEYLMRLENQLSPSGSGGPTPSNTLSYLNFLFDNLEDPGALGLDDSAMLGLAPQFGLNLLAPEES